MSRANRLLKSQTNITNEESYAFTNPTDAAFISAKIMERNEEKKSVRQTNKIVHAKRKLVENKKTEGQEAKKSFVEVMENEAVGYA
tara:strand:- start:117 stop:374 length:258 start_codon:yes stop_codon:yes gene_type:complete